MATILDNREHELKLAETLESFIKAHLVGKKIESIDGLKQATCQTGEEYVELEVLADSMTNLIQAVCGAVAIFGVPGCRCYWRTIDIQDIMGGGGRLRAYVRFCMTNSPELRPSCK